MEETEKQTVNANCALEIARLKSVVNLKMKSLITDFSP